MKFKTLSALLGLILLLSGNHLFGQSKSLSDWVNPFIGTGGHGHTYPGTVYPFGMVQLSPDTRLTGWDGCSAYHYTDSISYGFSHTHLSGTGVSDYGDILLMPYNGTPNRYEQNKVGSHYDHQNEKASPGYYQSKLIDYNIDAELTVTERCGFHAYTYNADSTAGPATILLDLVHRDYVSDSYFKINNNTEVEGYRFSSAWARDQKIYFVMQFSIPFQELQFSGAKSSKIDEGISSYSGDSLQGNFIFDIASGDRIYVKIGISSVDIEGARKNLREEIPNWDFPGVRKSAKAAWNKQLSKIQVFGGTDEDNTIFYTALYHTMIVPNIFSDVDGRYRGLDSKIYQNKEDRTYTVFSLWDTYRATHPLYTLIEQERTVEFVNTFINHYEQSGLLPVWELAGNETNCMIGTHGVSVIADAINKGITGFDIEKAYAAMEGSLEQDKVELNMYRKFAYMPSNEVMESVSKTLEYAYDDWCLAQTAKQLGKTEAYAKYLKRAQFYKNLYDPSTGFMRPKLNGSWRSPFDPREVDFNYTEANSWQYSFYVPQDINGLIQLSGGKLELEVRLDQLFNTDSQTTGRDQADITGLIGQYAHGNEPSHHMAYLYNFVGKPDKTQYYVKRIMKEMYSAQPDGYAGNEDCGQMSAWYVFSALGFYPVTPGSGDYILGIPKFPRAIINFENGQHFIIENIISGKDGNYVKSVEFNRQLHQKSYIKHNDMIKGGRLVFITGDNPTDAWAVNAEDLPVSSINEHLLVVSPDIKNGKQSFTDEYVIELVHPDVDAELFYRLKTGKDEYKKWKKYKRPLLVKESGNIEFYAKNTEGEVSYTEQSQFNLLNRNWTINIDNAYSSQYTGGGTTGLIDQIRGKTNFADGSWQGYQGVDFVAHIDFGEKMDISKIELGFLQSQGSWIWLPEKLTILISKDGKKYTEIASKENDVSRKEDGTFIRQIVVDNISKTARFVKIIAKNAGNCPEWHPGAGGKTWIFIDEIIIE